MTYAEFKALEIGTKVKAGYKARTRKVAYVYDDPCGARIVHVTAIQGCAKSIDNLDPNAPSHYSNWRLADVAQEGK